MRQVTQNAINSFIQFEDCKDGNTEVLHKAMLKNGKYPKGDHFIVMELHGHEIAAMDSRGHSLYITNAGWQTNTTKERLNGLNGVSIQQKRGVWYLNGKEWNGEWTKVN